MASPLLRLRRHIDAYRPGHLPVAHKLGLSISLLIIGCVTLLGLVIINQQSRLLHEQMDGFGQAMVEQLAETSKELVLADDSLALNALIINLAGSPTIMGAAVYHRDGHPLARSGLVPETLTQRLASPLHHQASSYAGNIHFQDVHLGTAVVTLSQAEQHTAARHAVTAIALSTLIISLMAGIAAFLMGKHLSRPIDQLMIATRAIGTGDYRYRLESRRRDEIGQLMTAFNRMARGLEEKSQVEGALSRYVSVGVARKIMNNLDQLELGGHQVEASVLFADIAGFTSLSEQLEPDQVARLLNEYFSYVSRIAHCYRGTIDKFLGDGVMVVFGVTEDDPDHRFHAIACGVMLQRLVARLNRIRVKAGQVPVRFRVGVNSGLMLAGNMGADDRMQYTVVGDAVNLAARLMASGDPGQVIIPAALLAEDELAKAIQTRSHGYLSLRGKEAPVHTCVVEDVSEPYRPFMERNIHALITGPAP
ncbi:adenylate/guanylate cyclase domain-containing protein [Ectothiorhodospira lacustris]|uniref:adenylate/guanylate cyclase domain-containing protein n=1 Tax=Ectothiorhodospira lacustris TaxID=2899127 RepID=UPI001EE9AE50|nr:adenylate/guanylate cyclase domain-containing protein [Ectothiorhodospira lacustris]MCG5500757.1 HAMP domain-containing protein [Ectothiorhodospira lacustris]MCG5510893.1 HAMP domain-containing protein [Ectothiorhodospira lacustris]MCG5522561.1 HAMP domain-containing protein [Ectothiorhodospira lacustris]